MIIVYVVLALIVLLIAVMAVNTVSKKPKMAPHEKAAEIPLQKGRSGAQSFGHDPV